MQYEATAKYLRISPRKVRLVARAIRPLTVEQSLVQLSRMRKLAAIFLKKVIDSALSNAKAKNGVGADVLRFSKIIVSEGPSMKRWHAVSRGMAHAYKKRMTHITVVLTDNARIPDTIIDKGDKNGTKN